MIFLKRTWAEINLDNLAFNVKEIQKKLPDCTEMMAVVKANAYGHGDRLIANELQNLGIHLFGVSNLEEAISLRNDNIKGEILILGASPENTAKELSEFNVTQTVFSLEYAKKLNEKAVENSVTVNCHIKLDTGMGRIGFNCDNLEEIVSAYNLSNLNVTGIFSHLSSADDLSRTGKSYTLNQAERFNKTIADLENKNVIFKTKHLQNSAGILNYKDFKYDMVRAGIILYGLPVDTFKGCDIPLKPVMKLFSTVSMVKDVKKGDFISYSRKFKAKKDMRLATVPIGYADGYLRAFSNKARMIVNGHYADIVGAICMDQLLINVTNIPNVKAGDTVTVVGAENDCEITFSELAKMADTIHYELACLVGKRVPRVYQKNGKIFDVVDYII